MNKKLLLKMPKCKLIDLPSVLFDNIELIGELFGTRVTEAITNIVKEGVILKADGHNLLLFNKEKVALTGSGKRIFVNPREVVWSLYLASQAIFEGKSSFDKSKFKPYVWTSSDNLTQTKYISLITVGGILYPVFDWTNINVSQDDKLIVVMWITLGRPRVNVEALDGGGFLTVA